MTATPDSTSLNHQFYGLHQNFTRDKRRAEAGTKRGYTDEDVKPLREQFARYAAVVEKLEAERDAASSPDPETVRNAELGRRMVTEAQEVLRQYDAARPPTETVS